MIYRTNSKNALLDSKAYYVCFNAKCNVYYLRESRGEWTEGLNTSPPPPPLENCANIGFLSNTGLVPLENHKTAKPYFNVGLFRPASETPFKMIASIVVS